MSLPSTTAQRLVALCAHLGTHGMHIAPSRVVAAGALLEARKLSLEGEGARQSALQLGPVLCRSAAEQRIYKELIKGWAPAPSGDGIQKVPASPHVPETLIAERTLSWLGLVMLSLALLVLGALAYRLSTIPAAPPRPAPPKVATAFPPGVTSLEGNWIEVEGIRVIAPPAGAPVRDKGYLWLSGGGAAFFTVLLVIGLWWLRNCAYMERRRASQARHAIALGADLHVRLDALTAAMRALGLSFRQRQRGFDHRLNMPRTAEATARRAGLFTGVYGAPRERRFLALVRRQAIQDHQAFIGEALIAQLCRTGADVLAFRFDADANVVEPYVPGANDGLQPNRHEVRAYPSIGDALLANAHAECLVFCEPAALLDPLSGRLAPWSRTIVDSGHRCTVLSVGPAHRWDAARGVLAGHGIRVVATDTASLNAMAHDKTLPVAPRRSLPGHATLHADCGLYGPPPDLAEVAPLCDAIRGELGYAGFKWVQACAVYPEIQWPLTNAIGKLLVPDEAERAALLLRLADLVWFRKAYMPDWLRAALIVRLDRDTGTIVRRFFWDVFAREFDSRKAGNTVIDIMASLPPKSRVRALIRWLQVVLALSARASNGPQKEQLFARYLLGRPGPVSMRIPHRVMAAMRNALRVPGTILAMACMSLAGVFIIYGANAHLDSRPHIPVNVDATVRLTEDAVVIAGLDRDTGKIMAAHRSLHNLNEQWRALNLPQRGRPDEVLLTSGGDYLIEHGPDGVFVTPTADPDQINLGVAAGRLPAEADRIPKNDRVRQWISLVPGTSGTAPGYFVLSQSTDRTMRGVVHGSGRPEPAVHSLRGLDPPTQVAVNGGGEYLVMMYPNKIGLVQLIDNGGRPIRQAQFGQLLGQRSRIAWVRDGSQPSFAECSTGGTVVVWNVGQSQPVGVHQAGEGFDCSALAVSPGGRYIALGSTDGRAVLIDVANPSLPINLTERGTRITDISFNSAVGTLAMVTANLSTIIVDLSFKNLQTHPPPQSRLPVPRQVPARAK